jgi:tetratricopeptide (TPR) repeat protein
VPARSRTAVLVAVIAVLAAAVAVGGALLQGGGGETAAAPATSTAAMPAGPPALELAVSDRDDEEAQALRSAERLYERDRAGEARVRFEELLRANPDSVEAAIGAAVTAWPDSTVAELEELVASHPDSGVARLNLGLVRLATGDTDAAQEEWREAEARDPDSPAALRAEDLLNPRSPPGRPQLVLEDFPRALARLPVERRIAEARRLAEGGGARDWILLGSVLESAGHRESAREAYDAAVRLAPGNLEALVGAATSRFDKDEPSAAFSRLGPLAPANPNSALLRFHLGLMLLWLPDLDGARTQLERARTADPDGFYGRQAARILTRLEEAE